MIALLGSGGMGDVYRARDTRLSRDVAIKILPDLFARDADRRARFEREAQTVASLSHPNIVNVFDTGSRAVFVTVGQRGDCPEACSVRPRVVDPSGSISSARL